MKKDDVVIAAAARTAIGKYNGTLKNYEAPELGGIAIKAVLERSGIKPEMVDEVVMGCVAQAAKNSYLARMSAINAGLPVECTALTVNRLCSSGLQAIVTGANEITLGDAEVVIAGGAEAMDNIPFYLRKARYGYGMGHGQLEDGLITVLSDPFSDVHMGVTAENVAAKFNVTREEQDVFALASQQKAVAAIDAGYFKDEIIPLKVKIGREEILFDTDEYPRRDASLEKLAKLRPAFKENGTVTAGNSSGINDGGAAVLLMKAGQAESLGLKPMARFVAYAVAAVPPEIMGIGPIPAVKKLLAKTGLTLDQIGLIELNEAFAAQSIACIKELKLDQAKVNVNGGAIALGHPIGASGAIITMKLINEMARRQVQYGIASLCIGGGQGLAALFELA